MKTGPISIMLAICLMAAASICSCDKNSAVNEDGSLNLVRNGKTSYSIVFDKETPSGICESLSEAFKDITGAKPSIYQDGAKTGKYDILVGETDRKESSDALNKIGKNGYAITVSGGKVAIIGSNIVWTSLALKEFETRVLNNPLFRKNKKLIVPGDYSYVQSYDEPQLIAHLVQSGVEFTLNPTPVLECPGDEGMVVAQGAASDGKHFYFLNRSPEDGQSIVYKYDMKTLGLVAKSKVFDAGHANDATFDFGKNRFIAAHGHSEGKILTPLDPETLEVGKNIDIPVGSGAITYNKGKGKFAISQGGKTLYVADNDFNVLSSYTRTDDTGYTAQGMGCDDFYVYFPMSGSEDNVMVTYDWTGNLAAILHIPLKLESESMFYTEGNYYVNFYAGSRKGAALYRVDPVYNYNYEKE